MNTEEFDINQDLEQMRQDYADLKERFDQQQIINEQLMEKAFKADARWLSLDKKVAQVAGVALVLFLVSFSIWRGVPWHITFLFIAIGLISVLAVLWLYKKLSPDTLFGEDILTATKKIRQFKQRYLWLEWATWVVLLAVMGAISPLIYRIWSPSGKATLVFVMLAVWLVICAVFNVFYFRRLMKACDSILERLQMKEEI